MLTFNLAFRSVLRNWRHSSASVLSVALGFLAIATIQGYYADCDIQFADSYVNRTMTGHIIIDKRSSAKKVAEESALITLDEMREIESILRQEGQEIHKVVRFLSIEGIIAGAGPSFAYSGLGYDVLDGEIVRGPRFAWNAMYGKPLSGKNPQEIVIGKGLAELLGCKLDGLQALLNSDGTFQPHPAEINCLGQKFQLTSLTEKSQMNASEAIIQGIVDAGMRDWEDSWLMMPLESAQALANTKRLTMYGVHLKDPTQAIPLLKRLNSQLKAKFPEITIARWQDHPFADVYRTMMGAMVVLQIFMLSIVIVVSALSMMNTVTRNIDERQAEIGTLRALGYQTNFVVRIFALEGAILGVIGCSLGLIGIFLVSSGVSAAEILYHPAMISQKVPLRVAITPSFLIGLGSILSAGAALTAYGVARFKIRQKIADILRQA